MFNDDTTTAHIKKRNIALGLGLSFIELNASRIRRESQKKEQKRSILFQLYMKVICTHNNGEHFLA